METLMKNTLMILALILFSQPVLGQSFNLQLDHSTILVSDLDRSATFYKNILHLKELETPWGVNPRIRFFSVGGNQQLHIAQLENDGIKLNKAIHIAFAIQDFDAFLEFLKEEGVEYENFAGDSIEPQSRPDGVKQIYLQDPDGYWVEINNAEY
jgi:catechol 2,3-dioxygenase-like lactoylglutathione lyase family enzyme